MVTRKRAPQQSFSPAGLILQAYFRHPVDPKTLTTAIEMLKISGEGFEGAENYPTLLDAAVAHVLLGKVEDELPQNGP